MKIVFAQYFVHNFSHMKPLESGGKQVYAIGAFITNEVTPISVRMLSYNTAARQITFRVGRFYISYHHRYGERNCTNCKLVDLSNYWNFRR